MEAMAERFIAGQVSKREVATRGVELVLRVET
jgi:hypothetical protein